MWKMNIQHQFHEVIEMIKNARYRAFKSVNSSLIGLYWDIGIYISRRIANEGWGKSTVQQLANFVQQQEPGVKGFSDKNLWRMKQFYESYKDFPNISALLSEISWTHNLVILSKCRTIEEKEFYLRLCKKENYSYRELERQINSSYFERVVFGNKELSAVLRELPTNIENVFKETYVLEFLNLPETYKEADLKK